jgi:hypothetical protein
VSSEEKKRCRVSNQKVKDDIISEISLLVEYGVEESDKEKALLFLERAKKSPIALTVLKDFYSTLPGAEEEPVINIVQLEKFQGGYLLGVVCPDHEYLYLYGEEKASCVGPLHEGVDDTDILTYFGLSSNTEFQRRHPSLQRAEDIIVVDEKRVCCPICAVEDGEFHILGCAVEVCPWCGGQLSKCGCRFEEMKIAEYESEDDLSAFEELLEEKGRVSFTADQAPAYPEERKAVEDPEGQE